MRVKLVVLLLFLPILSFSQSYLKTVKKGNLWGIFRPMGLGTYIEYEYTATCDTVIGGKEYVQLKNVPSGQVFGFAREDTLAQQVYFLQQDSVNEKLVVDYSLQVGDTFELTGWIHTVDTISTEFLYGKFRRVIHFDTISWVQKFIEGIGYSLSGITPPYQYGYQVVDTFSEGGDPCWIPLNVDLIEEKTFTVYPVPFNNTLIISTDATGGARKGALLDLQGRRVKEFEVATYLELKTPSLPVGLYILRIEGYEPMSLIKAMPR